MPQSSRSRPLQEDIILPQHYTFYELIKTKARGKSGPLFEFSVVEDIRLVNDATKEKTDSHAGKVVERHWYDRCVMCGMKGVTGVSCAV